MREKTRPERIVDARKKLGLGECATSKEVKVAYRQLAKQCHPDVKNSKDSTEMSDITDAYKLIIGYIHDYRYSFKMEDMLTQNPEWMWERAYSEDSMWGKTQAENKRAVKSF